MMSKPICLTAKSGNKSAGTVLKHSQAKTGHLHAPQKIIQGYHSLDSRDDLAKTHSEQNKTQAGRKYCEYFIAYSVNYPDNVQCEWNKTDESLNK